MTTNKSNQSTTQQPDCSHVHEHYNRKQVLSDLIMERLCSVQFQKKEEEVRLRHSVYLLDFYGEIWAR